MNVDHIKSRLNYNCNVHLLETVNSTNTYSMENNLPYGDIVIAKSQTNGRGRTGKSWLMQENSIAMSIAVNNNITAQDISKIPLIFGFAVCTAINNIASINTRIKWPNDIVIGGKKLCGILCEAKSSGDKFTSVVCGAGINVNETEIPEELSGIATSLLVETNKTFDRNILISEIANEFNALIKDGYNIPPQFNSMCVNVGNIVTATKDGKSITGKCTDISKDGNLIMELDGKRLEIMSSEVSVRGIYGYY